LKLVDLNTNLVNFLRNNVPNPHTSGQWIYISYPRPDATFPRISVIQIVGSLSPIGIGEYSSPTQKSMLATLEYEIDVWVKRTNRATFNSQTYVGTKLRDYLAEQVIQTLIEGKQELKDNYGILDIEILSLTSHPLDEELELHRKTIGIRVTFEWEKSK